MCFKIREAEKHLDVFLYGFIGVEEATSVRQALFPLIFKGIVSITFHLGTVTAMDSSGLGLLLAAQKMASDIKASVSFKDVQEPLRERLVMAGISLS